MMLQAAGHVKLAGSGSTPEVQLLTSNFQSVHLAVGDSPWDSGQSDAMR